MTPFRAAPKLRNINPKPRDSNQEKVLLKSTVISNRLSLDWVHQSNPVCETSLKNLSDYFHGQFGVMTEEKEHKLKNYLQNICPDVTFEQATQYYMWLLRDKVSLRLDNFQKLIVFFLQASITPSIFKKNEKKILNKYDMGESILALSYEVIPTFLL